MLLFVCRICICCKCNHRLLRCHRKIDLYDSANAAPNTVNRILFVGDSSYHGNHIFTLKNIVNRGLILRYCCGKRNTQNLNIFLRLHRGVRKFDTIKDNIKLRVYNIGNTNCYGCLIICQGNRTRCNIRNGKTSCEGRCRGTGRGASTQTRCSRKKCYTKYKNNLLHHLYFYRFTIY